jgi:hypothetical protein
VFSEQAFGVACSQVTPASAPTWLGVPVSTTLTPGVVAHVTIVLHRNGQAVVSSDFQDDASAPRDGGQDGAGPEAGGSCTFFYDDSTLPLLGPGGVRPPLP